ncbi:ribonuclease H1 domain-containing protein [Geofilum sp. OHC36d9]|uniref:ribonuclease H1 domain-containing protein n=1 Tax=Geofilum sp. OHC36d9 TaxID=3458413 RepID=UPI0040344542
MSKTKFYVVWKGRQPGIYSNWADCQSQVFGFEKAIFKGFATKAEAEAAFKQNPWHILNNSTNNKTANGKTASIIANSLSVDAACSGNPGVMEYRGVHVGTREQWFLVKFPLGTNNIGEFLAIVHGLAELKKKKLNLPVYTDSATALAWVKKKKCGTKLPEDTSTASLFEVIRRAEKWLRENQYSQPLLKWDTKKWGEIPADFGRK